MPYEDCGQPAGAPSFSTSAKMAPPDVCLLFFNNLMLLSQTHGPQDCRQHPGKTPHCWLSRSHSHLCHLERVMYLNSKWSLFLEVQTRLWCLHFQKSILICSPTRFEVFCFYVELHSSEEIVGWNWTHGPLAEEDGRNVEWKGCGKLIICLISRARSVSLYTWLQSCNLHLEEEWLTK